MDDSKQPRTLHSQQHASDDEVARIMADPNGRDYHDLRDRAAYVYATGSIPTHLRTLMNSLLRKLTIYSRQPASLDGRLGSLRLDEHTVVALGLDNHPMIRKVRQYLDEGYRVSVARDHRSRRPYSKVLLVNPATGTRITVQADGSIKDGWT